MNYYALRIKMLEVRSTGHISVARVCIWRMAEWLASLTDSR